MDKCNSLLETVVRNSIEELTMEELYLTLLGMSPTTASTETARATIMEYLDCPLPYDWNTRTIAQRWAWFRGNRQGGTIRRDRISAKEIWVEALDHSNQDIPRQSALTIRKLMQNMPGWKEAPIKAALGRYGVSRCFVRIGGAYDKATLGQCRVDLEVSN